MTDQNGPYDLKTHIDPVRPAQGVGIGKKLAAAAALHRAVKSLHDPVKVPLKPIGIKAGQRKNGKLTAFHAPAYVFPPQFDIPRNADLDPPGVAGGHPQVDKAVAEKGIEELLHGESLVGWRKYTFLFDFLKLFVRAAVVG